MADDPREIELKFSLEAARGAEVLAWLGQGRRPTCQQLNSVYFDTEAETLREAGFVLRVRSVDDRWVQTLKSRTAASGEMGRGEWEEPVKGPKPDPALVRRSPAKTAFSATARLEPKFTVSVKRQALDIRTPDSVIEACLDCGTVEALGRQTPLEEVELELKAGGPAALFALARRLQEAFAPHLDLSVVTKADRGFALRGGGDLQPRRFLSPTLDPRMAAGAAFQAMARAALEQVLWNAAIVRKAPSAEAIHQMRVGLRRLRSTLKTFKAVVEDDNVATLKTRLKWLTGELGPARGLDVFIEAAPLRSTDPGPALIAERAAAYDRAQTAAAGDAMRTLAMDTLVWIETGPWTLKGAAGGRRRDRPAARFAARALDKGLAKVIDAGRDFARLSPEERHQLRIEAKSLRYAADVFDQLFDDHPKRAKRFLSALEVLLNALGALNDEVSAETVIRKLAPNAEAPATDPEAMRGLVEAAAKALKAFKSAEAYWPNKT
jgi:inorganic triphosphatase YgiF